MDQKRDSQLPLATGSANMRSIMNSLVRLPVRQESQSSLSLPARAEPVQLDSIKAQLDLVLLALEALAAIGSEEVLKAAANLHLDTVIADRVTLWRLRQSNPLRQSQGGRKKLDVEEARSLVLISCYLAQQHYDLIRQAVALLEELTAQNRQLHEVAILGNYLDAFCNYYQERMGSGETLSPTVLSNLALKLLNDLLFYSAPNGPRYFWLALLERSTRSV
jgi:hypothetical protein